MWALEGTWQWKNYSVSAENPKLGRKTDIKVETYMYLIFYIYGLVNELMKVLIDLVSYAYISKLAERN